MLQKKSSLQNGWNVCWKYAKGEYPFLKRTRTCQKKKWPPGLVEGFFESIFDLDFFALIITPPNNNPPSGPQLRVICWGSHFGGIVFFKKSWSFVSFASQNYFLRFVLFNIFCIFFSVTGVLKGREPFFYNLRTVLWRLPRVRTKSKIIKRGESAFVAFFDVLAGWQWSNESFFHHYYSRFFAVYLFSPEISSFWPISFSRKFLIEFSEQRFF